MYIYIYIYIYICAVPLRSRFEADSDPLPGGLEGLRALSVSPALSGPEAGKLLYYNSML